MTRFTSTTLRSLLTLCLFACPLSLLASEAVVTQKANLRKDPSATQKPIQALDPDEVLDLIDPKPTTNRYYHVKTGEAPKDTSTSAA